LWNLVKNFRYQNNVLEGKEREPGEFISVDHGPFKIKDRKKHRRGKENNRFLMGHEQGLDSEQMKCTLRCTLSVLPVSKFNMS
jgi:hypothetical protein